MNHPPPPPPHGNTAGNKNGLPDGNYDIFIIPPHSAGGGFLYLPSLQPQRNSFLAGVVCALMAMLFWVTVRPVLKEWFQAIMAGGGISVIILCIAVGVACWAFGKTQAETYMPSGGGSGGSSGAHTAGSTAGGPTPGGPTPQPQPQYAPPPEPRAPPKPTWQRSNTGSANGTANAAKTSWDKAREELRKKKEEEKKAEELAKKREDAAKERELRREKEARERAEREARERREKELKELKEARERREKERSRPPSPTKSHQHPTAKTATEDDAYSFRPYDNPKRSAHKTASASSIYSESSYAPSQSTARTTPPPSQRGPYRCKDPNKIVIKAVYSFNDIFPKKPIAQLISGKGSVTDGLVLRIESAGLFIDDDVRDVGQREWDIKAWTLKLMETGEFKGLHVLRASIRDTENKRYVFVLSAEEGWKVAVGLQRLRRGTQCKALGVSGMAANEMKAMLDNMGFLKEA